MSQVVDPYDTLALHYDEMHAALNEDIGMVLSLAAAGGPVLELGCGTGRLMAPLARAGHHVYGLDRAWPMLARARRRLAAEPQSVRRRARLIAADMRHIPFAPAQFALALIPYNTLMHLNAAQAATACRAIRRTLVPGGRLFIDVANPLLIEETTPERQLSVERVLEDRAGGDLIVVTAANSLNTSRQLLTITWIFDRSPRTGGAVTRSVAEVDYHYYFPHQLELLLADAGLALTALYGSYSEQPYSEASERLLLVATRPEG